MLGDSYKPNQYSLKNISKRCMSTSTSNGIININDKLEEEWFLYETITQKVTAVLNRNFHRKMHHFIKSENDANCVVTLKKGPKNLTKKENVILKQKSCTGEKTSIRAINNYEIIFDAQAAGDTRKNYVSSLPMRKSLFPYVAPYIIFHSHNCNCSNHLPKHITRFLKWRLTESTPRVVIKICLNSGYELTTKGNNWSAIWNGSFSDVSKYRYVKSFQKVNSFPGSSNLGNKSELWIHLNKMRTKFGRAEFNFMPRTYVLPRDMQKFKKLWQRYGVGSTWIVKPPSSGRGQGIKVINQWWEIPKWHSVVVQRYISKPKLINGSKFDLRIYVLLTSINPTRIYLYQEGLVRFASVRYVRGTDNLNDKYMHLTNTSVNKRNPRYIINNGVNSFRGHKWSLNSLWLYFREEGVDINKIWSKIKDIVIKTIIAVEPAINAAVLGNVASHYTCYELYGFDILLDENYRPWLLEANVIPSLQTDTPLDLAIKGPLVSSILNIAGYQIPNNGNTIGNQEYDDGYKPITHNYRLYTRTLSLPEKIKQNKINALQTREEYLTTILEELTRDDLKQLIRYEDEFSQAENFEKIFPTKHSYVYLRFFEVEKYYDRLLDAWEHRYSNKREKGIRRLRKLCEKRWHLDSNLE